MYIFERSPMSTSATISKWGNSQGIRLPKSFCDQLHLSVGDEVSLSLENKSIIITRAEEQYTLEARLKNWNGKRDTSKEFDWGKPVGQELW